jgi:hypothetical protein
MPVADLLKAAALIDSITRQHGLASAARDLPKRYASQAEQIKLSMSDVSFSERDAIHKLGSRAVHIVIAQERQRGEMERDALLAKYAAELESLRAVLPHLAAKAAIELGEIARGLADEARGRGQDNG